jgi:hypothetical protein
VNHVTQASRFFLSGCDPDLAAAAMAGGA